MKKYFPDVPASRLGCFCVAGLLGLALTAHAAPPTPKMIDLDGDQRISYDEFVHSAATHAMQSMDADKNGTLSRSEVKAGSPKKGDGPAPLRLTKIDSNGDGQVDLEELKKPLAGHADMKKAFNALDKDKDGYLSGPELNGVDNGTQMRVVPQISIRF
jgi:Ca2+-binding EF-hand superfamily protein